LAISVSIWLPRLVSMPYAASLVTTLLVASNLYFFYANYYEDVTKKIDVENTRTLMVAKVAKTLTATGDGLLVFGNDWSSDIAYYAERKSFTVPGFFGDYDEVWRDPQKYLGSTRLGAIVICPSQKSPSAEHIAEKQGWAKVNAADCVLLIRNS